MFTGDYPKEKWPVTRIRRCLRRLVVSQKRQYVTVVVVFVVVFLISRDGQLLASLVTISDGRMVGFLSTVSQAIAALLGLLIAAVLFVFGSLRQDKDAAYGTFKAEMRNLIQLWQDRPEGLKPLDKGVDMFIRSSAYHRRESVHTTLLVGPKEDMPSWSEAGDVFHEALVENDIRNVNLSRKDRLYLQRLLVTLNSAEEAYSAMGYQLISGIVTRDNLNIVYKLSGLLAASLLLLVLFSLDDLRGIFPDLTLPFLFAMTTWAILALLQLANEVAELREEVEKS